MTYSFDQFYFFKKYYSTKVIKPWIDFLNQFSSIFRDFYQKNQKELCLPVGNKNSYRIKLNVGEDISTKTKFQAKILIGKSQNKIKDKFFVDEIADCNDQPTFILKFKTKNNQNELLGKINSIVEKLFNFLKEAKPIDKLDRCFQYLLVFSKKNCLIHKNEVIFYLSIEPFYKNIIIQIEEAIEKIFVNDFDGYIKILAKTNFTISELVFKNPLNFLELFGKGFEFSINVELPEKLKFLIECFCSKDDKKAEKFFTYWEFLNEIDVFLSFKSIQEFLTKFSAKSKVFIDLLTSFNLEKVNIFDLLKNLKNELEKKEIGLVWDFLNLLNLIDKKISLNLNFGKFAFLLELDYEKIDEIIENLK